MNKLPNQRHLFDIPDDIAYFNCAYNSPLLKSSVDALQKGVVSKSHPWEREPKDFFEDAETIRTLAAELFGGEANGYAIIPAASYGLSTIARIFESKLKPEDEILLMTEDFPSVVLPFQRAAKESGAKLIFAQKLESNNWTKSILDGINKQTKIVAISSTHWTNGAFIDLMAIRTKCNEVGAILAIDATQTLGATSFNITEIKPDFMVCAGYKWLLCPYGFSLMYVDKKWWNERPLEETWIARKNAENFANLVNYSPNYMEGSRRFEVGQKCTPTILPGAIAAFQQLKNWGISNIATSLNSINETIANELKQLGFKIPLTSERYPNILGVEIPENIDINWVTQLKKENIFISQRGNSLRFAPHLHINENDVDHLVQAINKFAKFK